MCAFRLKELEPPPLAEHRRLLDAVVASACRIILGKEQTVRLALACLIARGHLLIEDIPGVGKTTLAHVLARVVGLNYQRIQFTSDLLPADILGVSVYDRGAERFQFHPGPIFAQLVLADEVNRATPKAQSALLEAMEEHQVTQEGVTRALPEPFFVIATQNPSHQVGTFPLPESQLDRFLMRIQLGYPDPKAERALLMGRDRRDLLEQVDACMDAEQLLGIQRKAQKLTVSEAIMDYIQDLIACSREAPQFESGLSPRAGLALLRAARAWALMDGRDHVLPEDVQAVLHGVVSHRLQPGEAHQGTPGADLVEQLIRQVPIP